MRSIVKEQTELYANVLIEGVHPKSSEGLKIMQRLNYCRPDSYSCHITGSKPVDMQLR